MSYGKFTCHSINAAPTLGALNSVNIDYGSGVRRRNETHAACNCDDVYLYLHTSCGSDAPSGQAPLQGSAANRSPPQWIFEPATGRQAAVLLVVDEWLYDGAHNHAGTDSDEGKGLCRRSLSRR